ncbi:FtsX-like permease family protein [Eubacteriaceae bacterium ES2]|nr:FtsX-like permease family protein [Eubacteriaceae bacterium ES2]
MKALQKDILREIKKTKSRFISIVAIIALGVCFFVGIKATGPSMEHTANVYYETQNLMDFRLLSTYGFQADDIAALENTDGVEAVMAGYSADVIIDEGENRPVIRLYSVPREESLNQLVLVDGRLPQNSGEIVIEAPYEDTVVGSVNYEIGDTITLDSDLAGEPRSDTVKPDTYTIVGFVRSPQYVSFERGTTTVGNGNVAFYGFIPEADFGYERYTEAYVKTTALADGESAFSDQYWTLIDGFEQNLESLGAQRLEINYSEIMNEAQQKLNDGYAEYNDGLKTFLEGIASGETELADARAQLVSGEIEIEDGYNELYSTMASTEATLADSKAQLDGAKASLIAGQQELDTKIAEANAQLDQGRAGIAQLTEAIAQMEAADPSDQLPELEAQLAQVQTQIDEGEAAIAGLNDQIAGLESQIAALDPQAPDYQAQKALLEAQIAELNETINGIESQLGPAYAAQTQLQAGIDDILNFQQTLDQTRAQLAALEAQVAQGQAALEVEQAAAEAQLSTGWNQYYAGLAAYNQGLAQYQAGINQGFAQLSDAEAEIADGWNQYYDGLAQLEEGRAEGQQELDDAALELADAQKEVDEIETGKWYFFDRDENPGYRSYGEDATRINNIANVFPLFFLLVAALVSFTTMTRMVEEQRTQIGTLKALGYRHSQIASKFIIYAILAGLTGAVIGIIVGLNTLPYLIAGAYGMMYQVPDLLIDPPWLPIMISAVMAVLCTVAAAGLATIVELREQPSELMRPKAPKIGKNILLERIPLIWNRLGFIEKVTARNLMRYKGRFFMTVIGIAGCTALILAGFGLQDAITTIIPKQFGEIAVYDGLMAFKEDGTLAEKAAIKAELDTDGRFSENMLAYQTSMKVEKTGQDYSKSVYLLVPETIQQLDDYIHVKNQETGQALDLSAGAIITEKASRDLGIAVGDTVTVFNDDESYQIEIAGIAENYLENYLYLSPENYQEVVGKPVAFNVAYINIPDTNDNLESEIAGDWLSKDDVVSMNFTGSIIESSEDSMGSLNIVILVLILSAAALAGVVLYNLTNINISERVREIATIRVLGFYDMETYNYIFRENIVLAFVGVLVGLFLGTGLNNLIINTMETDMTTFVREIELSSYLLAGALTIIFTLVINVAMTPIIKRINMVESLKSIE